MTHRYTAILLVVVTGHRLPTWQEVVERDDRPWDVERIVIDTARLSVEQGVRSILAEVPAAA
jgi:hypothetical protein